LRCTPSTCASWAHPIALIGLPTVFTFISTVNDNAWLIQPAVLAVIVVIAKLLLDAFFASETGLALRATGANPRMARAQGISTDRMTLAGMALSNALIALAGAIRTNPRRCRHFHGHRHHRGGPAAVIIGETLLPPRTLWLVTLATVLGALLYRLLIALALNADFIGLQAQDLNLITAVLVGLALVLPKGQAAQQARRKIRMMRADNLFKTFNPGTPLENPVLRGLSLTIESGQFVTVIGSNGAGKSTFLNAISGDISPDTGSLFIDGQDVTRQSAWQRAALVARVFQDPLAGTCEGLTIEENLALAMQRGQGRGLSRAVKASYREAFRDKLSTSLGLENRLGDRMGLLRRSAPGRQPADGILAAFPPAAAGRAHCRA
jgi:predicted ABC-type transport system involved in lysophospholipase L1 biosynthesis ATPase subunit